MLFFAPFWWLFKIIIICLLNIYLIIFILSGYMDDITSKAT